MQNRKAPGGSVLQTLTDEKLRIHLTPFSEYTSMTPEAVALILQHGFGDRFFGGTAELSGLTSVPDEAAEFLNQYRGTLNLNKVTEISDLAAARLGKHQGELRLNGLTCLTDAAAEGLCQHRGSLSLNGLTSLTDTAAISFAKHEGALSLNGIAQLSDVAIAHLSKHKGKLFLDGMTHLSVAAATSVTERTGWLSLHGLTDLAVEAAETLSRRKGILHFNIKTFSDDVAATLRHMTKEIAEQLVVADFSDYSDMNSQEFRTIDDSAAECLIQAMRPLNLNGLENLSDAAATSLSKCAEKLSLQGLATITDQGLLALSSASPKLSSLLKSRLAALVKQQDADSSRLDRMQHARIKKLLTVNSLSLAVEVLHSMDASEADWLAVFSQAKMKELVGSWDPSTWNTLAEELQAKPRVYELLKATIKKRINYSGSDPAVYWRYGRNLIEVIREGSGDLKALINLVLTSEGMREAVSGYLPR